MQNQIQDILKQAIEKINKCNTEAELLETEKSFLGKKGSLNEILKGVKDLPKEDRAEIGKLANQVKQDINTHIQNQKQNIQDKALDAILEQWHDVTLPGIKPQKGAVHPLSLIQEKVEEIFQKMGFMILDGPEVESDYFNFDALNFKKDHPARDMHDTYFVGEPQNKDGDKLLLRTHTSPVQVRGMLQHKVPIKAIIPGRCFRYEDQDATHEHTLFQIEGLYIDKNISIANLKGIFQEFLTQLFEKKIEIQMRPGYFPFTEPSVEFDFSCPFCKDGCRVCKYTKFIELAGAGMVHPNVLKSAKVDPNEYQGFAFGFGLDRLAMLYHNIQNIKHFRENDIRFLKQF